MIDKNSGSPNWITPTAVGYWRKKILDMQRWSKSLLYHKPIQGYARLAAALRNRFARDSAHKDDDALAMTYEVSSPLP